MATNTGGALVDAFFDDAVASASGPGVHLSSSQACVVGPRPAPVTAPTDSTQSKQKTVASPVTLTFLDGFLAALGYAKVQSNSKQQHQVSLTKVLRELNDVAEIKPHLKVGNTVVTADSVLRGLQQTEPEFDGGLLSAANVRSAKFNGSTNSVVLVDVRPPGISAIPCSRQPASSAPVGGAPCRPMPTPATSGGDCR